MTPSSPLFLSPGLFTYFVSDSVRSALFRAGGLGTDFVPLKWDNPKFVQADYWELRSQVLMPDCRLPVVDTGDGLLYYFEEGFNSPEPSFNRNEVQNLGGFDLAFCRESIGNLDKADMGRRLIVVSQEFRSALKRLLIADQINFIPVRLV